MNPFHPTSKSPFPSTSKSPFGQPELFHPGEDDLFDPSVPEENIAHRALKHSRYSDRQTPLENARNITSQIIELDKRFTDDKGKEKNMLLEVTKFVHAHGIGYEYSDEDHQDYEKVLDLPFIQAISFVSYYSGQKNVFDLRDTYLTGVRAMNSLALLIDQLNNDHRIQSVWIKLLIALLEKIWDIGICLLGTIRTRARLIGRNHESLAEANVIHATHYRRMVDRAINKNEGVGKVCNRALYVLTRTVVPPFVRPLELLSRLNKLDLERFHTDCTTDECKRDSDGTPTYYHLPTCDGKCGWRVPPTSSLDKFNYILDKRRLMPSVNIDPATDDDWFVATSRKTLAISHVWRDGIHGTRDDPGLQNCLHKYFTKLAKDNSLDSYWIDCATIPADETQRQLMIQMINYTFHETCFTLCCDNRIARVKSLGDDGTSLLTVVTSFWHRRAWTLLEGHKADDIRFFREPNDSNSDPAPFQLQKTILSVLDSNDPGIAPLWLLSSIAELEPYVIDGMTAEASGILLSSRKASRPSDSELIWRLLSQPYTSREASTAASNNAFDYSTRIDGAFISSNAKRSDQDGFCWMPAETNASEWVSYAIGGQMVNKSQVTITLLKGQWFQKDAATCLEKINWASKIMNEDFDKALLQWKLQSELYEIIFICPILLVGPKTGEWDRAIILTRPKLFKLPGGQEFDISGISEFSEIHRIPKHERERKIGRPEIPWHWETIVELKSKLKFTEDDISHLTIGMDNTTPYTVPQVVPVGQSALAIHAASELIKKDTNRRTGINYSRGIGLFGTRPASLAVVALIALMLQNSQLANASTVQESWSGGTESIVFWVQLPDLPSILSEWAALLPLTVYLSSVRSDFELAGEVSLRGGLSVSIIPRLWAIGGIVKLVKQRDVFFDTASAGGDPLKVYDVQWGSVFPCYNSAAALAVAETAFQYDAVTPGITDKDLNGWILANTEELSRRFTLHTAKTEKSGVTSDVFCGYDVEGLVQRKRLFGRRQLLKVIVVTMEESPQKGTRSFERRINSWKWRATEFGITTMVGAALFSIGCLGSGALVVVGGLARFCTRSIQFDRSPLYLRNREVHDGCMLVAVHENATSWTLYLGHRGLIDSLLNKPMVDPGKAPPLALLYLQFAELLQVIGMTYVAGQKGWDAIVLLLLILIVWITSHIYGSSKHAAKWLKEEGFTLKSFTCEFPGRTELLGAVQLLSTEQKTYWMDGIICPVPRRDVWLKTIGAIDSDPGELKQQFSALHDHDQAWVNATGMQTIAGYALIRQKLKELAGDQDLASLARR